MAQLQKNLLQPLIENNNNNNNDSIRNSRLDTSIVTLR